MVSRLIPDRNDRWPYLSLDGILEVLDAGANSFRALYGVDVSQDGPAIRAEGQHQMHHHKFNDFPNGFLWGAASAAYQVEGAWNEGGQGPLGMGQLHQAAGQDL